VDVARLDALLGEQVDAILHHPRFQKLEASWRGLRYLTEQAYGAELVKIRVLDVSWSEVARDIDRAIEFDQSQLFGKVYNEEFGTPGGEPFGVLLGDYAVRHRPSAEHRVDDLAVVQGLSQIAAAAFSPLIMSSDPAFLGLDSFSELGQPLNLSAIFRQAEYTRWQAFRDTEDSRFVGLTLPKVLMRLPYQDDGSRGEKFRYEEQVEGPDSGRYLWGNAAYAYGGVLVRAFAESGWLANVQGVEPGRESGGLVTGLPLNSFGTDIDGLAHKYSTDVLVTDYQEKELGELGFIPLCHCKDTSWSAFYGSASAQKPKQYDRTVATVNARLSGMLQYMFCVSRFAHYLKVIGRDKMGSFASPQECQDHLQRWLHNYTIASDDAGLETKAKHPLREGKVQVREQPGKPGSYACVVHLRPHFQLDQVITAVQLITEISPGYG
jgi:type VI secretion system protein ImpD